ncbi:MAG TPA: 23S rRNA pseudouridine(1911/1915/1917) synthase RluD [Steroidobacteraceae bacterium]|jgi:23S rRNA pseudouridine1911/1915/1917 synthase|nr:23S rRNA pseudouridine(1911/1915/1917) synthase RluD [Steroidobacteraceae bacterium]
MSPQFQTHQFDIPAAAAGQRLDQALAAALPQYSRARLQRWIREGAVRVAGRAARARDRVHGGEQIELNATFSADSSVEPEAMSLAIVHQDHALLVVNKPAGLVVHPGAGNPSHTLQNALLAHDPTLARVPRAGLIHRLDKDTSGLLIVARTPEAHTRLVTQLAAREIHREYLALVLGAPTGGARIDQPIGRHRSQRTRMSVRGDGRQALTHYRIEERFLAHTLLRVQLETGRTHQIRVHLAHAGYPVVGDPVYGGRRRLVAGERGELNELLRAFQRQALHAQRLRFAHPLEAHALTLEAPAPQDFQSLLKALRADARAAESAAARR